MIGGCGGGGGGSSSDGDGMLRSQKIKLPIPKRGSRARRPPSERSDGFAVTSVRFAKSATVKRNT